MTEKDQNNEFQQSLFRLLRWIENSGYVGYDPYDIKGQRCIIRLTRLGSKNIFYALARETVFELFYTFPRTARKLFRIQPTHNAKATGLIASSYLDLYSLSRNESYYAKALSCLDWLKANKAPVSHGAGWGYPFDWQSKELIAAGTPNGIVTTVVGDAFWNHFRLSGDKESLAFCSDICKFLSSLPIDEINPDQICFSYTPLFINHVHNLNLFVAEFLLKTGMETGRAEWIQMSNRAVTYTLANQSTDGSFDYNGPPEKPQNHFDNYHTGFVLRMLYSIWKLGRREDVFTALHKCYSHYIHNFFENGTIPKLMPGKKYRIDIHSCAESIHCLSALSPVFPEGLTLAESVLNWTIDNLQDESGYFYYGILKSRFTGIPFKSKIPYIRWGEAWMMRAIVSHQIAIHTKLT
jgi:hypothetical protein